MILSYQEAVNQYGSEYRLLQAISANMIFKQESGIYSTEKYETELGIITKKYPKAVLSGEYAFYMHGLTDLIPEKYVLATPSKAAKITDTRVRQEYVSNSVFLLGIEEKNVDGSTVRIYDKERMLIELLRHKNTMPYDLYKEILLRYRECISDLEIWRIQEYVRVFPKSKMIAKALDEEVL